ncbi:S8 family serine peptidase [Thiocystis violacea]|uniref:S8 family serine peptidase n=1 Tax=Thiocystis violacea TaxID=13725 RepID=UPI001904131A|nr:S8 family serine peptidase [Thiocystis violacea]
MVGATLNGDFKGYSGQGQVIAILDTGVDKSHAFLKDKIVSEACYSTNNSSEGVSSLCPQGVTASTAIGSGVNCNASLSGCSHGTHVAGIAAGKGEKFSGVAREAKLISIQVYSRFPASACGGAPCAMAYTSDIIRGLERVRSLGTQYAIAAANLSLGGGAYTSYCDWDSTKPMIDALLAEGIATVIASGNGYYSNAISAPGCVSSAITVGSTTTKNSGTYPDQVSDFSNSAHFLDLLAPGERIESSVIGGGYAYYMGTSMAAPHVAGAWAVLKSAKPNAEVEEILAALQTSGKPIQDPYNSLTKQRIQVDVALANLQAGEAPTQPSPSLQPKNPLATAGSAINSQSFVANWNGVNEAAGYRLDVSTVSNFASYLKGYRDLDVAPTTSRSIDGLKPSVTYFYRVRAYNSVGTSLNSNVVSITTTPAPPPTPTGKKATSITTDRFTANWGVTTGAVGYRLDVSTDASFRHFLNGFLDLDVGNAISFKVTGLSPGMTYYYRGRAYNSGGVSGSSKAQAAKTLVAIPQAPSARPATNITTKAFVANWDLVDGATGYRLDVSTSAAFTSFLSGYNNLNVGNRVYRNITRLSPNTIYYYRVRAYNKTGTGLDSGIQTVRTAR